MSDKYRKRYFEQRVTAVRLDAGTDDARLNVNKHLKAEWQLVGTQVITRGFQTDLLCFWQRELAPILCDSGNCGDCDHSYKSCVDEYNCKVNQDTKRAACCHHSKWGSDR